MEETFNKLLKANHNTVDNLIQWMKVSKIVDGKIVTEEMVRKLFSDVKDAANVELAKFKEAIGKLATDQKKTPDDFNKVLAAEGPKVLEPLTVAATSSSSGSGSGSASGSGSGNGSGSGSSRGSSLRR